MYKNVDDLIEKELTIKWNFVDFFYAYCANLGIDDPETEIESEEEYTRLEKECESLINYTMIAGIRDAMIQYGNEIISNEMM